MKIAAIIIVTVAVIGFTALNFHFILLDGSLKVLTKTHLSLEDTFVDARGAKKFKLLLKPALLEAGVRETLK
ncbi:MAG: hypothetical protein CSB33_01020 [Desulfobacterales bacterium]|nr:MAG: hypothetical protein CSB33_01020 [Desulfobacterales bacterium]